MEFFDSVKELYNKMASELDANLEYCKFAPDIDDDTLERNINLYAKDEEPSEILCIGKAKSSVGIIAGLLGHAIFFFTSHTLYIENMTIGFSEIDSIVYKEKTKTGLFGKVKTVKTLVISKKSGEEEIDGNIAVESIAEFLNDVVKKYKENPPAKLPQREYPRSKLIADTLDAMDLSLLFKSGKNFDKKKINSFVIKFAKEELAKSFAANYEKELYFSNDYLFYKEHENYKKIPYEQLSKAIYSERQKIGSNGESIIEGIVVVQDSNGATIYSSDRILFGKAKEMTDFLNKVISNATGKEVKTETQQNKVAQQGTELKKSIINAVRSAFAKGNLRDFKTPEDKRFSDLHYSSKDDVINELWHNMIFASFLSDRVYMKSSGWKTIPYSSISKAVLRGTKGGKVGLDILDDNGNTLFQEGNFDFKKQEAYIKTLKELSDLINKIASVRKGDEVKTSFKADKSFLLKGTVLSDGEDDKKRWSALLSKWNEIFSKDVPIICLEQDGAKKTYSIENAQLESDADDYGQYYSYYPDPKNKDKKSILWAYGNNSLWFKFFSDDIKWEEIDAYYLGGETEIIDFYHAMDMNPPAKNMNCVNFLNFLRENEIGKNYTAFSEKLKDADKNFATRKEQEKRESEERENKKKQDALDDLSNW